MQKAILDWNYRPQNYWDGRGLFHGDANFQRSQASMPIAIVGEYLPQLLEGEVEIVFIALASTTGDVISLRARPEGQFIRYRMVDEYESPFTLPFERTHKPLTFRRLTQLIKKFQSYDEPWLEAHYHYAMENVVINDGEMEEALDQASEWMSFDSEFYPQLSVWYQWDFHRRNQ